MSATTDSHTRWPERIPATVRRAVPNSRSRRFVWLGLALALLGACSELDPAPDIAFTYAADHGPWLTPGDDPATEIAVSWLTAEAKAQQLRIAPEGTPLEEGSVFETERGHLHRVRLTGLVPDVRYTYDLPSLERGPFEFRSLPAQADVTRPLRIGVVGDMQPNRPALVGSVGHMVDVMSEVDVDAWVQVGDLVHDGGRLDEWEMVLGEVQRWTRSVPLFATIGNHDMFTDDGDNWARLFAHPFADGPEGGRYYSVDLAADVHLVFVDNFDDGGEWTRPSDAQLAWLDADLAAARAAGQWVFVFMHISLISTGTANTDFSQQEALVPLLHRHAVDAVFYGHDHMYEHYHYTYGADGLVHAATDAADPQTAVHYFLTGGGGAALESSYGLVDRGTAVVEREWVDAASGEPVTVEVEIQPWNPARIARTDPAFAPEGDAYGHDCAVECYQSDAERYGHEYGENTLHYMVIEATAERAVITAHRPDGRLIDGLDGNREQRIVLTR